MINIKRVMARKDAWSVLVAIILSTSVGTSMYVWPSDIVNRLWSNKDQSGFYSGPTNMPVKDVYLRGLAVMVVSVVLVEVGIMVVTYLNSLFSGRKVSRSKK